MKCKDSILFSSNLTLVLVVFPCNTPGLCVSVPPPARTDMLRVHYSHENEAAARALSDRLAAAQRERVLAVRTEAQAQAASASTQLQNAARATHDAELADIRAASERDTARAAAELESELEQVRRDARAAADEIRRAARAHGESARRLARAQARWSHTRQIIANQK